MTDLATYDSWEPKEKRAINSLSILVAVLMAPFMAFTAVIIWLRLGYSTLTLAWFLLLLPPQVLIHELVHALFQWLFTSRMPKLGFKFPFPYSRIAEGASLSRNHAILTAIAPLAFFTCLAILTVFVGPIAKMVMFVLFFFNTPSCAGDVRFVRWLSKYPVDTRVRLVDRITIVFKVQTSEGSQS